MYQLPLPLSSCPESSPPAAAVAAASPPAEAFPVEWPLRPDRGVGQPIRVVAIQLSGPR